MVPRQAPLVVALLALPLCRASPQTPSGPPTVQALGRAVADSGRSVVAGVVFDSVANKPLAGATVQVVPQAGGTTLYSAVTDSAGAYRIAGVPSGRYIAGFLHPALDALGLEPPQQLVTVGADRLTTVHLAIWSAATIVAAICPRSSPADSTGLLLGYVRDADTRMPLPGSAVVVIWTELVLDKRGVRSERRQMPTKAGVGGWYGLCGVPANAEVLARAEHPPDSSGFIEIQVSPGGLEQRDFLISSGDSVVLAAVDSADPAFDRRQRVAKVRRGTAQLTGTVRSAEGKPLAGANVLVWGSGLEGTTNETGTFTLTGLPGGTHSLEVRYLGYAPMRATVDLANGRTTITSIVLGERATVLGPVRVWGKRSPRRDVTGFLERRERGFGHHVTREDIEKQHALLVTDALRRVPGVRLTPTQGLGYAVTMRGGCIPDVFIDGIPISGFDHAASEIDNLLRAQDVAGIEVYTGTAGVPAQFRRSNCGSVVIWTGRLPR